ncbi:hypothetical protein [Paenibacillus sedimenti]|uniref:Uncharacterized protein n=1 Tax=Paenibacillus sedimenti TaxID=2770274 RepID=A0A926KRX9_9BACL|nr:hypothetical protein [Paenibacillus sedimenti]MBD0382969.1 hypothetical protein [Paenibacillus sedimenti]
MSKRLNARQVRIEHWAEGDLELLRRMNAPEMMEHLGGPETEDQILARHPVSNAICRKLGFSFIKECEFEYPPGSIMRCNNWRLDLYDGGHLDMNLRLEKY